MNEKLIDELKKIEVAMEHMGDVINGHDMATEEDEDKTTPGFEALHRLLAQSQQPVAPIGVELAGVQRIGFSVDLQPWHRNFSEPLVIEIPDKNGQYVRFSDLEKLLALPQTEKGEGWVSVDMEALPAGFEADLWVPGYGRLPMYRLVKDYHGTPGNHFFEPIRSGLSCVRNATHYRIEPSPPQDTGKVKPN